MSILLLLIPLALIVLLIAGVAFFWAVGEGQFDDLDTPAMRILLDDDSRPPPHDDSADNADGRDERSP